MFIFVKVKISKIVLLHDVLKCFVLVIYAYRFGIYLMSKTCGNSSSGICCYFSGTSLVKIAQILPHGTTSLKNAHILTKIIWEELG